MGEKVKKKHSLTFKKIIFTIISALLNFHHN